MIAAGALCYPGTSLDRSHRRREDCDSPEGRPAKRLSMLMSSSRSGQWIPSPSPINRQLERSAVVPCAKRGYHDIGTVTVRPSARSTTRESSVTCTSSACADRGSVREVFIPLPEKEILVFFHQLPLGEGRPCIWDSRPLELTHGSFISWPACGDRRSQPPCVSPQRGGFCLKWRAADPGKQRDQDRRHRRMKAGVGGTSEKWTNRLSRSPGSPPRLASPSGPR